MRDVFRQSENDSTVEKLTNGLGWFSIGLGLAELMAPRAVGGIAGVGSRSKNRSVLRLYGLREIAAGIGILTQPRPAGWMWARVAGDALDVSSLISAFGSTRNHKGKLSFALASVAGVTAADLYCAQQLSARNGSTANRSVTRSIILGRPIEEVYNFWHNFENLPRFMTYLESVRPEGDRRSHWIANGPAGARVEWDAEIVADEPNRRITWRSIPGSMFEHSGSVRFAPAPGNRGTMVSVEIDYSRDRGASTLGKLLQIDLGRRIMHDLRNFKQVLEVGEVTQSDAGIHPGIHPAQPEPTRSRQPEPEPAYQY